MTAESATRPALERQPFTSSEFRSTLGGFATGITVVTTQGGGEGYGMTANAFSSLSLDPPLILICVASTAKAIDHFERNGIFAVNILAAGQEPLSRYFSSRDRPAGEHAFAEVPHHTEATGAPILDGVAAFLDCKLHESHVSGDHHIIVGDVMALNVDPEIEPLIFHGGRYRLLGA